MLNLSGIDNKSVFGRLLRLPLKLIPKNAVLPVMQGPLKGKKWISGSGTHGYWLGSYESSNQKVFIEHIKHGNIIYDIGANVGFYTLLFSEAAGITGSVYSFEPFHSNVVFLKKHLEMNKVKNVHIVEAAVGINDGKTLFKSGENNSTGRVDDKGETEVNTLSLDTFIKNNPPPGIIKMDLEGGEYEALLGAQELLKNHKPVIFLSVHSDELKYKCLNFLSILQYKSKNIGDENSNEFICLCRL